MLHRDLKPANVMIDGRGKLLITDFGLAEIADDIRGEDIRCGTPAYMSPEQLAGREVTVQSDIYSLGSILHEIYTGKPVWQADSMMELLEKRKDPRPTPTSDIDSVHPAVASVINRCLDPNPAKRPATAINIIAGLPGGDPVRAALAAGKTPSPKMIADSGGEGRLSLPVGAALYALICIVAIAIPFLVDWIRPFDFGDLAKNKPEVLEQSARSFTESFGYETIPGNEACGFQINGNNQFEFWYRQSENLLTPDFPPLWAVATTWQISASNPALVQPGMVTVRLNSAGELMEFLAIPSSTSVNASPSETDWAQLLAQAGINAEDYELDETTADSPELRPPTYMQQIRMWKKRDDPGNEKIIAASYWGKGTYFRRYSDPTESGLVDSFQAGSKIQTYSGAVTTLFLIVAVVFAIRNLQTMRVEVPTALNMGLGYLALDLLVWIVQTGAISEIVQNRELAANFSFRSLAAATRLVIYYMAFEPIIRRYWPDNLTAWARLISGRFTDPLIGSNILIGTLIGICWWLCVQSDSNSYPLVNYPTSPNSENE